MTSPIETELGRELHQLASGQPFTPDLEAIRQRARQRRRHVALGKAGAGVGVVAVGAAVALVATSAPQPAAQPTAASPLMTLAAHITKDSGPLPGNATLIIRTQNEPGLPSQGDVSYNLYTDNGAYYGGAGKQSLTEAVDRHQNMADGINAREVAAARYAAAGSLATARVQMADAAPNDLGLGLGPAARKALWDKGRAQTEEIFKEKGVKRAIPVNPPTGKALQGYVDNYVWNNSTDALDAGAGNPQVRAGVMRLLSTISGVAVAKSVTDGQPTLTLTAGPEVFGGAGEEVLTVNAETGMPVKAVFPAEGNAEQDVQTFQVQRLTLADVAAGKF